MRQRSLKVGISLSGVKSLRASETGACPAADIIHEDPCAQRADPLRSAPAHTMVRILLGTSARPVQLAGSSLGQSKAGISVTGCRSVAQTLPQTPPCIISAGQRNAPSLLIKLAGVCVNASGRGARSGRMTATCNMQAFPCQYFNRMSLCSGQLRFHTVCPNQADLASHAVSNARQADSRRPKVLIDLKSVRQKRAEAALELLSPEGALGTHLAQ